MSRKYSGVIVRYIQESIANGKSDVDGIFVFSRKELIQAAGISPSTFDRSISEVVELLAKHFDFCLQFQIPGYKIRQANVFVDVSYEKGKLKFRRNPLTESDEFKYMWEELRPKYPWFTFIYSTTYIDRLKEGSNK